RPVRVRRRVRVNPDRLHRRGRGDAALLLADERAAALMGLSRYTRRTLVRELPLVLAAFVYCLPFYLVVSIALETSAQPDRTPLSFPCSPPPGHFSTAWRTGGQAGLDHALLSSLIITVSSVVGLIVLGSLCAYTIARRAGRLAGGVYVLFVLGIILPF